METDEQNPFVSLGSVVSRLVSGMKPLARPIPTVLAPPIGVGQEPYELAASFYAAGTREACPQGIDLTPGIRK